MQNGIGLVEADVTVLADSEELDVHAAELFNFLFVCFAGCFNIFSKPVGNEGVCLVDIYMIEQIAVHEITEGLVMCRLKAFVFIKVYSVNF